MTKKKKTAAKRSAISKLQMITEYFKSVWQELRRISVLKHRYVLGLIIGLVAAAGYSINAQNIGQGNVPFTIQNVENLNLTVQQSMDAIKDIIGMSSEKLGGITNFDILASNYFGFGKNGTSTPAYKQSYVSEQTIQIPVNQAHGYWCNPESNNLIVSDWKMVKGRNASTTNTEYRVTAGTSTTVIAPSAAAFYVPTDTHDIMLKQIFAETSTSSVQARYNSKVLPIGAPQMSTTSPNTAVLRPNSCVQFTAVPSFPENRHCVNTAETCETATSTAGYTAPTLYFKITSTSTPKSTQ